MELLGASAVSSVPGSGTVAILRLPLASGALQPAFPRSADTAQTITPSIDASSRNINILLVDDHAMVRQGSEHLGRP